MSEMGKRVAGVIVEHAGKPMPVLSAQVILSMYVPTEHAVAAAADKYGISATKAAAVWMTMIEEMLQR